MAKNKFLTTNYGYKNSSNRYAFKIDTVSGSSNTTIDSIVIKTGDKTQEFLDTITNYVPNETTGQEAIFYNCSIRTTNSLYSEPRLLEISKQAEDKLKIIFWTVTENKGQYTFSKSALQHPSASMVKTNEADNLNSGKIHNVFFLDEFPLLGNVEIGCYSVNIGYENIGGQVSTFSNGQSNMPLGDFSSTFGWKNKTGYACSAFGFENKILGQESSGFGAKITIANGAQRSAGFGANHTINVNYGMAFGYSHQIIGGGTYGTAFGLANSVKGKCGLAAGNGCISNSENSFSFGEGLRTWGKNVAVFGQYNAYASNGAKTYLFAIGNGTSGTNRKNALELDLESNLKIEGDLITKDGKLSENIELLEKYGTTNVYVLQEGIDFIYENGLLVSCDNKIIDCSTQTVVIPEIEDRYQIDGTFIWLKAKELIVTPTFAGITGNCVQMEKLTIPEGVETIFITDSNPTEPLYLPSSLKELTLFTFSNNDIYFSDKTKSVKVTALYGSNISMKCPKDMLGINLENGIPSKLYIENPHMVVHGVPSNSFNLYGYAGSTAELFANDEWIKPLVNFINIGSDYSININETSSVATTIQANQYYQFTNATSLAISLDTISATKLDEFMFSFKTPSDVSKYSLVIFNEGAPIKWIKEPKFKPNYIYEVSIVNGVGVIAGTVKEVA